MNKWWSISNLFIVCLSNWNLIFEDKSYCYILFILINCFVLISGQIRPFVHPLWCTFGRPHFSSTYIAGLVVASRLSNHSRGEANLRLFFFFYNTIVYFIVRIVRTRINCLFYCLYLFDWTVAVVEHTRHTPLYTLFELEAALPLSQTGLRKVAKITKACTLWITVRPAVGCSSLDARDIRGAPLQTNTGTFVK